MPPLRDLQCEDCDHIYEALIRNESDLKAESCCKCESKKITVMLSYPSNYTISGNNSASVRPKRMGGKK